MSRADWMTAVRAAGVARIAHGLGFEVGKKGPRGLYVRPCPSCGLDNRHQSRRDRRGAIGLTPNGLGFRCHECNVSGDAVAFAALAITGTTKPKDWSLVLESLGKNLDIERVKQMKHEQPTTNYPSGPILGNFWGRRLPLDSPSPWVKRARDYAVADRKLGPLDALVETQVAYCVPEPRPEAYPGLFDQRQAYSHRLACGAYDASGTLRSVHLRATQGNALKTLWPAGYAANGLVFADAHGLAFLRSKAKPEALVLVEGMTDTIAVAAALWTKRMHWGVLGISSGSMSAIQSITWPTDIPILVGMDSDSTGQKYTQAVLKVLNERNCMTNIVRWDINNCTAVQRVPRPHYIICGGTHPPSLKNLSPDCRDAQRSFGSITGGEG